jgi:hypothetical protein
MRRSLATSTTWSSRSTSVCIETTSILIRKCGSYPSFLAISIGNSGLFRHDMAGRYAEMVIAQEDRFAQYGTRAPVIAVLVEGRPRLLRGCLDGAKGVVLDPVDGDCTLQTEGRRVFSHACLEARHGSV